MNKQTVSFTLTSQMHIRHTHTLAQTHMNAYMDDFLNALTFSVFLLPVHLVCCDSLFYMQICQMVGLHILHRLYERSKQGMQCLVNCRVEISNELLLNSLILTL